MSIGTIIFFILIILIFGYVFFTIFFKAGRNFAISKFMGEIIQDYGLISETDFMWGKQKIRLLKCRKNQEIFYIIETEYKNIGAIQINYTKINNETANKFINILSR